MDIASLVVAMLLTGAVGGILAGLLGVGGGIVIVPMIEAALAFNGIDESIRMHVAVATSLATIIPTSIASTRAHQRRHAIDFGLIRYWSPFIVVGAIGGIFIAANVGGPVLALIFAVVALIAGIKMILPLDDKILAADVPRGPVGATIPLGIGAVSTLMGIGGGTLSVPAMTLSSKPIHLAVGTSALFGLVIALPSTIGYIVTGWGHANLPIGSLGYVNLPGFALIAPATVLFAPLGAKIAHSLSHRALSLLFGLFLLAIAIRMGLRAYF